MPEITKTPEPETKGLLGSKTTWGVLIMVAAFALEKWGGISLDEATQSAIADDLTLILGAALAIFGRIKASGRIDDLF